MPRPRALFCGAAALAASASAVIAASAARADEKAVAAWDSVVQAEEAFSNLSFQKGMRDSFLANFADDVLTFPPNAPIRIGTGHLKSSTVDDSVLTWHPVFAAVGSAGDLGYTTGPWEYRKSKAAADSKPVAYGNYISVWKRQTDGAWKVVTDFGAPRASESFLSNEPDRRNADRKRAEQQKTLPASDTIRDSAIKSLLAQDTAFGASAMKAGFNSAFETMEAPQVQVYSYRRTPAIGDRAANKAQSDILGVKEWHPDRADASRSGDLGYTVGTATLLLPAAADKAPPEQQTIKYKRIWRRADTTQPWQILLEVMNTTGPALSAAPPASGAGSPH